MAFSYKKVERKQFAQSVRKITPENQYWNAFRPQYEDKLHLNVPFLRFLSTDPYDCVVCSHYDVRLFKSDTFVSYKRLGFKKKPLVADIRSDSKLLAVAGKNGLFRIYNNSPSTGLQSLRSLNGHYGDIHQIKFDPSNTTKIISFSNDKTCGYWDITSSSRISTIKNAHKDFIRSGDWVHNQQSLIISASYDHLCKLWDLRDVNMFTACFNHNLPIESCLSIPNSDLIAVAGGPNLSIWSIRKANKPLKTIKIHRKSVTCLAVNKNGTRLLSGCLDNYIRVFTINASHGDGSFNNTHSFIAPSSILSIDMSNNNKMIALGTLNDGIIVRSSSQQSSLENNNTSTEQKEMIKGTKDWFLRGQKRKDMSGNKNNSMFVEFKSKKSLKKYDIALKQYRYSDALDFALLSGDTLTVDSVFEDLWRRNGLEIALGGRDNKRLLPILEYLIYSLPHPHLTQISLHITAIVIDSYQSIIGLSNDIDKLFTMISQIINNMIIKYKILLKLQGGIEMILSSQDIIANPLPQKMLNLACKINKQIDAKIKTHTL